MSEGVSVLLKDGLSTSLHWDDVEWLGTVPDTPKIIIGERLGERVTEMPERWIRARVRGWMDQIESPDLDYWIGTFIGRAWVFCGSRGNTYFPLQHRIDFARQICRHVNRHCAHGGVWLTGWIRGGHQFYLLWKDETGDIKCPIECEHPFESLIGWTNKHWEFHCNSAIQRTREFEKNLELSNGQTKNLSQGEGMNTDAHLKEAPPIGL